MSVKPDDAAEAARKLEEALFGCPQPRTLKTPIIAQALRDFRDAALKEAARRVCPICGATCCAPIAREDAWVHEEHDDAHCEAGEIWGLITEKQA